MTIGYKLLTAEGSSLSSQYGRVVYPLDGSWSAIPGRGAFVGVSFPGLLSGGFGPLLAEVEFSAEDRLAGDREVAEVRRVRVLRTARIDVWAFVRVAIRCARGGLTHNDDPRVLAAILAAERCERERTPEAASWAASEVAWTTSEASASA